MAQQVLDEGGSGWENWHLSHDLAEIYATVAGHIIQLELTPSYSPPSRVSSMPANHQHGCVSGQTRRDPTVPDIHAFGDVTLALFLFRNVGDGGIPTSRHAAIESVWQSPACRLYPLPDPADALAFTNTSFRRKMASSRRSVICSSHAVVGEFGGLLLRCAVAFHNVVGIRTKRPVTVQRTIQHFAPHRQTWLRVTPVDLTVEAVARCWK